ERADHDRKGAARPQFPPDRRGNPRRYGRHALPLHDVLPRPGGDQARCENNGFGIQQGGRPMTAFKHLPSPIEKALENLDVTTSRRTFLKTSGLLAVSLSSSAVARAAGLQQTSSAQAGGPYPDPDYKQLDSWIVIHQDNTATFYVGKTDLGQGTGTAFRQM